MKAVILTKLGRLSDNAHCLEMAELPDPAAGPQEIVIKVHVCGVCHTELDEIEGRTPPQLPVVLGHQIAGAVVEKGNRAVKFKVGDRVGVGWIYSACGVCSFCLSGRENLCKQFRAAGRDANGGYAEYMKVPEDFANSIPDSLTDAEAAPLMCAGAIGYRSLRLAGITGGQTLGLMGFGASAHLVLKTVQFTHPDVRIFVFARRESEQSFGRELGAVWAGGIEEEPPEKLDAIIDTTPAWKPVVAALKDLNSGGRLIINAIRKENADKDELFKLDYADHLWQEKEIKSVANVTRLDIREFLNLAAAMNIKPEIQEYPLADAGRALMDLKAGQIRGAKVLRISA